MFVKSINIIKICSALLIRFYQRSISPFIAPRCRYYPTCSHYSYQAIQWHTTQNAFLLIIKRIMRCHPLSESGIDFVPLPMYRWHYRSVKLEEVSHTTSNPHISCVYRDTVSYQAMLNRYLSVSR